jgi:hypothetical protein
VAASADGDLETGGGRDPDCGRNLVGRPATGDHGGPAVDLPVPQASGFVIADVTRAEQLGQPTRSDRR